MRHERPQRQDPVATGTARAEDRRLEDAVDVEGDDGAAGSRRRHAGEAHLPHVRAQRTAEPIRDRLGCRAVPALVPSVDQPVQQPAFRLDCSTHRRLPSVPHRAPEGEVGKGRHVEDRVVRSEVAMAERAFGRRQLHDDAGLGSHQEGIGLHAAVDHRGLDHPEQATYRGFDDDRPQHGGSGSERIAEDLRGDLPHRLPAPDVEGAVRSHGQGPVPGQQVVGGTRVVQGGAAGVPLHRIGQPLQVTSVDHPQALRDPSGEPVGDGGGMGAEQPGPHGLDEQRSPAPVTRTVREGDQEGHPAVTTLGGGGHIRAVGARPRRRAELLDGVARGEQALEGATHRIDGELLVDLPPGAGEHHDRVGAERRRKGGPVVGDGDGDHHAVRLDAMADEEVGGVGQRPAGDGGVVHQHGQSARSGPGQRGSLPPVEVVRRSHGRQRRGEPFTPECGCEQWAEVGAGGPHAEHDDGALPIRVGCRELPSQCGEVGGTLVEPSKARRHGQEAVDLLRPGAPQRGQHLGPEMPGFRRTEYDLGDLAREVQHPVPLLGQRPVARVSSGERPAEAGDATCGAHLRPAVPSRAREVLGDALGPAPAAMQVIIDDLADGPEEQEAVEPLPRCSLSTRQRHEP